MVAWLDRVWIFHRLVIASTISLAVSLLANSLAAQNEIPHDSATSKRVMTLDDLPYPPNRWLLVICGLPGDAEHRANLTKATQQIALSGSDIFGIGAGQLRVLAGDAEMVAELSSELPNCEIATAVTIEQVVTQIADQLRPQDTCWVIVLGHGDYHNRHSYFNIEGPDIHEEDFARISKPLLRETNKHSAIRSPLEEPTVSASSSGCTRKT
jgi:hypothetical protein